MRLVARRETDTSVAGLPDSPSGASARSGMHALRGRSHLGFRAPNNNAAAARAASQQDALIVTARRPCTDPCTTWCRRPRLTSLLTSIGERPGWILAGCAPACRVKHG